MQFLSNHLDLSNLKLPIEDVNTICAFTNKPILCGVSLKHLIKKTFTDKAYIKNDSGYASLDIALSMSEVIPSEKQGDSGKVVMNSLRSYSYFVSEHIFKILKHKDLLDTILHIPEKPFYLVITIGGQKHTGFKAEINTDDQYYKIRTDTEDVVIDLQRVHKYLPIVQRWYSVIAGKADSKQQPTYFTKDEILTGNFNLAYKKDYPINRLMSENAIISQYRDSTEFKLIIHCLTKSTIPND